jgi:HSP20 family protein
MIIRHDPWNIINELSHILDNSLQRQTTRDDTRVESSRWLPAVDIKEEPNRFILYVDVPGVDPKNIEISMERNVLSIKGTRDETFSKEEKNNYFRLERAKGEFYRRFTLPDTADAEQINAVSRQGVLEITISKKKAVQSRKIEVQADG